MRVRAAAVLALVLVVAAGCAQMPRTVDGNLVDDWAMLAGAEVAEPAAGDCWRTDATDVYDIVDVPGIVTQMPCDASHVVETVHVGHFTGAQAEAEFPPELGELADQYETCAAESAKVLGAAWATGRLRLLVYTPTNGQWQGGARFFRCDVAALRTEAGILDPRKETLRDSLRAGGALRLGCAVLVGTLASWTDLTPAACTDPHDVEFAGLVASAVTAYPDDDDALETAYDDGCWDRVRAYTGSSERTLDQGDVRFGYWLVTSGQEEWQSGLRDARCYVMLPKKISRSLRDNGTAAI